MGVPVLTLSGRSFASRVCGSLVRSAGLPELVCTSSEEFIERAITLGKDRALLRKYRDKLISQKNSCTLFDTPLLVRQLEKLYRQIWDQHAKGKSPSPDLSNLDVYMEIGSQIKHDEIEIQTIKDYHGWWLEKINRRHKFRPINPDKRLFSIN